MTQTTPSSARQWQASSLCAETFRNDAIIYRQGDVGPCAYYIVSGHIKLTRLTPDGEEFAVIILSSGEIFGAPLAGYETDSLQETAYAKGTVQLCRFRLDNCNQTLAGISEPAHHVIRSLAKRQSFLQRRLEHLLYLDVSDRLSAILCDLITRYGGKCRHGHEIDIRITQQELAELAGASRSVVSTLLNSLRRRGIVSYTRNFMCIDDLESLRQAGTVLQDVVE